MGSVSIFVIMGAIPIHSIESIELTHAVTIALTQLISGVSGPLDCIVAGRNSSQQCVISVRHNKQQHKT